MSARIVIDTSVFISALIGLKGLSRELIRRSLMGNYRPLMSNALFREYEAVMSRENILARCPLTEIEIRTLLQSLISVSQWTSVYYTWRPNLKDEADNHLIELAVAGNAQLIATNNIKDFKSPELRFPDLIILKPEDILKKG